MSEKRELLFRVTAADCRWDYYVGSGKGGQAKQKTNSAVRCTHIASGAVGACQDGRSQDLNKRKAFERMAQTEEFKKWHKAECARRLGETAVLNAKVDEELLRNTAVQVVGDDGKWVDKPELAITHTDIRYMKEN